MSDIFHGTPPARQDRASSSARTWEGRVYTDEPIPPTASAPAGGTPPQYLELRRMARANASASDGALFARQAAFMANFEDNCPASATFFRYFPTYQSMSTAELRGYFSWRTAWRRGEREARSLSYAFLYIYELLCLAGCPSPQVAFDRLWAFWQAYAPLDAGIDRWCRRWLVDMAVVHGLPCGVLGTLAGAEHAPALALLCLDRADELLPALAPVSSYDILSSRTYREHAPALCELTAAAISRTDALLAPEGRSLCDALFPQITAPYTPFSSAVVPRMRCADTVYVLNPACRFICESGDWRRTHRLCEGKSRLLGAFLRQVDVCLRQQLGLRPALKEGELPPAWKQAISLAVQDVHARQSRARRAAVPIHAHALPAIRTAADEICARLTVAEEAPEPPPPPPPACGPLSAEESVFLRTLLLGTSPTGSFSLLCDGINQKLFDLFCDNVIDFDGERPYVIPDYSDGLKGLLQL